MTRPARTSTAPALVAVVVANAALAFGPLFVRLADTGPVAAAFWRMALAVPVLAMIAFATRTPATAAPSRRVWLFVALAGLAFAADLGTWHLGILHTTMANATLLGNSATFLFPLWGFLVARAWPTRMQGVALLLAAAGAALLMGRSYQLDPKHLAGDLLCIVAGVLYALYFILMSDVRRALAPWPALALSSLAALLPLLGYALVLGERIVPQHWTPLIALALVCQLLGQGCMIYALGRLSPLVIGLALLIQPAVAATIGWVQFGEALGTPDFAGIAMIAAALVLVRDTRRNAKEPPPANPVPEEMR
ncbi:drug/metabolite transporter (DMT)-like permease [Sphingomonas endophytica]|uniref:Drug/metabolite transporter (DMT)-like permease n=1 Tax=Sphingomonas endophytica TaxID=869719 RepID=A0A7X0JDG6_9SPHN|nr:DMT family transporter [Sphingomonas endophytica]MBB6504757.1 drug/metabolite transporter (DMT)-like permease [Sphingomonas endophytica]